MKQKILVAMSGGVDSSVTAALLVEEGHEVAGATIRTWASNTCVNRNTRSCCGLTGVEDARAVAEKLGIRYWVFNFEEEFKRHVVDTFASEYLHGRTPNPCILCNEHIKFRLFLKRARQLGFDAIATGHYARIGIQDRDGSRTVPDFYIEEGIDETKDQSYVLFPLDQEVLSQLHLPLGSYRKSEIREKARALGLSSVMEKPDSQEICFIPSNDHGAFLEREFDAKGGEGVIRTRDGKVLGTHPGYYHFTRGQRRGLGVAHSERLYVLETIPETNEVIVGTKEEVLDREFVVGRVNWFLKPWRTEPVIARQHSKQGRSNLGDCGARPEAARLLRPPSAASQRRPRDLPPPSNAAGRLLAMTDTPPLRTGSIPCFRALVKIRSQHPKAPATIEFLREGAVKVTFDEPQEAVTPGQAAVFYEESKVLGGGWIA